MERIAVHLTTTPEALEQIPDLPVLVRAALERDLEQEGADPIGEPQYRHYLEEDPIPRRWWEWLLRRPTQTRTVRLVDVVLYGERR